MAISPIVGSELARSRVLDRFDRSSGTDENSTDRLQQGSAERDAGGPVSDRLELSDNARKLDGVKRALETGMQAMSAVPDVREDRVAQAKERLASGHYDSDEVRRDVAAKLGAVMKKLDSL